MTRDEFKAVTGVEPINFELVFARCLKYSQGHHDHADCGVCEHGIPRSYNCAPCGRLDKKWIVIHADEVEDDPKTIKGYDGVRI
jgi:hypothetical protein